MGPRQRASSGFEDVSPGRRSWSDSEKDYYSQPGAKYLERDDDEVIETDEYSSSYSSRTTSGSHQPMLSTASAYSRPPPSRLSLNRMRHTLMQRICLVLAFALVVFMLTLVTQSWRSGRRVQVELGKGKKPPPLWESFPFMERYYGGVRKLVPRSQNIPEYPGEPLTPSSNATHTKRGVMASEEFNPYPAYQSEEYLSQFGKKVDCFMDKENKIHVPGVRMYPGIPSGFPDPAFGNNSLFGIRQDICYDRFGRLGAYGLGYSLQKGGSGTLMGGDREGAEAVWKKTPEVDYRKVRWDDVQRRCAAANKARFADPKTVTTEHFRTMNPRAIEGEARKGGDQSAAKVMPEEASPKQAVSKTAFIIRTWSDFEYTPESIVYLRSLVTELSLHSGGEYTVHFLIQVKDDNAPIWSDEATYDRVLREALPGEFHGMGVLWSERQMGLIYGGLAESFARGLPVHGVYRSSFMPLQYFASKHPEYEAFWNWEMDIRYTGHWYHFFDSITKWTAAQPRKGLWERNGRFYVPSEHGSWDEFRSMVKIQTQHGTNSPNNIWSGLKPGSDKSKIPQQKGDRQIWGPERPLDENFTLYSDDPTPPSTVEADKYTWGVSEPADLITFNPIFDPEGTTWLLTDDYTGYNTTRSLPPRRTAIITAARLSRRLLDTMHRETALSRHSMFSEMWPASCALHHGLKTVYAPHAEYIDRRWPTKYLESTFNAGRNGASGGARTSVFGDMEHNFRGTTWFYNAGFAEVLWNRWLGRRFNNEGGEEFEGKGVGSPEVERGECACRLCCCIRSKGWIWRWRGRRSSEWCVKEEMDVHVEV